MDLKTLKALSEKFRAVADDHVAVAKLADDTCAAHPTPDAECSALCSRMKAAADGDAVRAIADAVKARTS